ncbi:hypothetical protein [Sphingomonas hengshuiensis]|uniref:Uncharacterized protein n=1 Tax=Sphingomonas hengshuiensis TaxID=1609977 RepID=A0A7U4LFW0_9SPHN|nr:hypothetical protein [Sphingomonas hengshuiensis]AJP72924.1 hypothetical protein TS85_15690 [Sphingomonas hengshuiensis]
MASRPDSAARAAIGADVRRECNFVFLDLLEGPIRVTDSPYPVTFAGTGDPDLDGHTFSAVDSRIVDVGPVKAKETGTDTVTLTLSGLAGIDDLTMTELGDRANFQGRDARLWKMMRDPATLAPIGAAWSYYTGYMSVPKISGDQDGQIVRLEVETYLGFFTQASGRTYLDQASFDPGDLSAELAIAIANGASQRS